MRAIKTNLWALDNIESRDLLEDFILAMYDDLHVHISTHTITRFRLAIRHAPQSWYLDKWKALAFQHLEGEHFGQNRRSSILDAATQLVRKKEIFFKELVQAGIIQN
jgi:hypothetical protein